MNMSSSSSSSSSSAANIGFHPDNAPSQLLTPSDYVLAGAISSAWTRALCQPLDVLKIRLQLQVEQPDRAKYPSLRAAVPLILREEGPRAFWSGHLPAQYLSIAYGIGQFATFEVLTKGLYEKASWTTDDRYRPFVHFLAGAASGLAATVVSYPFDVVRTRLVAQGRATRLYRGSLDAARQMLRREGPGAFFRGILATFATIAPYSGCQFGFYSLFTRLLEPLITRANEELRQRQVTMSGSIVCGGLAGLCAKTLVFPFDVTKKRLQVQGFDKGRFAMGRTGHYRGMWHCLVTVLKEEGARGLFKGLSPGLIKAVATTAINFWFYEYACQLMAKGRSLRPEQRN